MPTSLVINGTSFAYPVTGDDTDWGGPATDWAAAVSLFTLQPNASSFAMTAETDFGASFGFKLAYVKSRASNPAAAGIIRLGNTESISWRNAAHDADLPLSVDSSNRLTYNGNIIVSSSGVVPVASGGTGISSYTIGDTLYASGTTTLSKLAIGAASTVLVSTGTAPSYALLVNANIDAAAAIAYSKLTLTGSIVNADINASAAIAYSKLALTGSIVNADINTSAAIARTKIANGTASHVVINDGSGTLSSEATLATTRGGLNIASYTTGDLVYASSSSVISKLAIGSTNQGLVVVGGVPTWQSTRSAIRNVSTAGQSISNAATPIIDFATADYITGTGTVTTGASWKFTVATPGVYQVTSFVMYASATFTAGNLVQLFVYLNGTLKATIGVYNVAATQSQLPAVNGSVGINCAATDTIDIRTSHGESAARTLRTNSNEVYVSIALVTPT